MTTQEIQIKNYVNKITKGIVNLKPEHLRKIVDIATANNKTHTIVLFKQNYQTNTWEQMKSIKTSFAEVEKVLKTNSSSGTNGLYRYDIYNADDECIKQIYSVNSQLF